MIKITLNHTFWPKSLQLLTARDVYCHRDIYLVNSYKYYYLNYSLFMNWQNLWIDKKMFKKWNIKKFPLQKSFCLVTIHQDFSGLQYQKLQDSPNCPIKNIFFKSQFEAIEKNGIPSNSEYWGMSLYCNTYWLKQRTGTGTCIDPFTLKK